MTEKKKPLLPPEIASQLGKRRAELHPDELRKAAAAGGKARRRQLMKMSKQERSELARKAAQARWGKKKEQ